MAGKRPGRPRKPGRPKKVSTIRKKRSSGKKRNSKKFIQNAIKRPGALTRAKKKGESTRAAAQRFKKSGTKRQKQLAIFYLNVLAPAARKRRKK
jgi:hypothetical protein